MHMVLNMIMLTKQCKLQYKLHAEQYMLILIYAELFTIVRVIQNSSTFDALTCHVGNLELAAVKIGVAGETVVLLYIPQTLGRAIYCMHFNHSEDTLALMTKDAMISITTDHLPMLTTCQI